MNESAPLVFISYARDDGASYAVRLERALHAQGLRTWRDERGIDPTRDFTVEIEHAIYDADFVVVCITPEVAQRDDSFVRREIQYALVLKKPVIVARFADVPPPINIINNTWIDFFGRAWDEALLDLIDILRRAPESYARPAAPGGTPDPFRLYVEWLYRRVVTLLGKAVIRLIGLDVEAAPGKTVPPPPPAHDIFDLHYLPYGLDTGTTRSQPDEPPTFASFDEAFNYYNGRLLLLGAPGAGKSVTMMAFARDAAARRLADPTAPLPVFGILATWDARNSQSLAEWLAGTHKALSAEMLQQAIDAGDTLLLLDGLDELEQQIEVEPEQLVDRVTGAPINTHARTPTITVDPRQRLLKRLPAQSQIVVSCRSEDYTTIRYLAALDGAIMLQPLNHDQMRDYLASERDLWAAVETDAELKQMLRTPLIMSLFAFAYQEQGAEAGHLRDLRKSPHALRKMIFDRYVDQRYAWEAKKDADLPFSLEEIKAVLGYVAAENLLERHPNARPNVLPFGDFVAALGGDVTRAHDCIRLAERLGFIQRIGQHIFRFTHLLLRFPLVSVEHLSAVLTGPDRDNLHKRAFSALAQSGCEDAVHVLVAALKHPRWSRRTQSADALAQTGTLAVPALIALLTDGDWDIRRRAIEILGLIGDRQALARVTGALTDDHRLVRRAAAVALGRFGDQQAVRPLIAILNDPDGDVRTQASEALVMFEDPQTVDALCDTLANGNREIRHRVAEILGLRGDPRAVPALIAALHDEWDAVRRSAAVSLGKIGTLQAVTALIGLLDGDDSAMQRLSAELLGGLGAAEAVPVLIERLRDADHDMRAAAARALGQIGDPRAVPALIAALHDEWDAVRENAAYALQHIGTSEALEALRQRRHG